jgi:hypothetical protein
VSAALKVSKKTVTSHSYILMGSKLEIFMLLRERGMQDVYVLSERVLVRHQVSYGKEKGHSLVSVVGL